MIPKIIHQTWKTEDIPEHWQPLVASWKCYHPDWEYRFWSDADGLEFVEQHFPDFLPIYESYSYNIQRADAIRYLILHKIGGLYADMDFECLKNFDDLAQNHSIIMAHEPEQHDRLHKTAHIPCNALMGAEPGHPFFKNVIAFLQCNSTYALIHTDVLETTGPLMLRKVVNKSCPDMELLPSHLFYPLSGDSEEIGLLSDPGNSDGKNLRRVLRAKGSYAVHYWENTWNKNLAGELYNPEPYNIPGFDFYPDLDSSGFDIENGGRDIPRLARLCLENPDCVGFNTNGFMKNRLHPKTAWKTIPGTSGNEGQYVKNRESRRLDLTKMLVRQKHFQLSINNETVGEIVFAENGFVKGLQSPKYQKWRISLHHNVPTLFIVGEQGITATLGFDGKERWEGRLLEQGGGDMAITINQ